jgi:dipeptidyl aminopeptidase/acylaminoacyl peptidase
VGTLFAGAATYSVAQQTPADRPSVAVTPVAVELDQPPQGRGGRGGGGGNVYKAEVTPHWFANATRFWYRNDLRGGAKEFIVVNAEAGTRQPAFDHAKLAEGLTKATDTKYQADKLPFSDIEFVDGNKAVRFTVAGTGWKCDLSSYSCTRTDATTFAPPTKPSRVSLPQSGEDEDGLYVELPWVSATATENTDIAAPQQRGQRGQRGQGAQRGQGQGQRGRGRGGDQPEDGPLVESPDHKWTAQVRNFNVFLKSADGQESQLSQDGVQTNAYGALQWAPDSKTLVAFRVEPGDRKDVYLIRSTPLDLDPVRGGRATLESRYYALPGDKFNAYELNLFEVATKKQTKPAVDRVDFNQPGPMQPPTLRWKRDDHTFTYQKVDRGHQRWRLIEVDTHTGSARTLLDEQTKTFVWTAHAQGIPIVSFLDDTDEIIWATEKDGYRHLYLVDGKTGRIKNPITSGDYVVRGVDDIAPRRRQIWFRGSGKVPGQDPYFIHYYRVNFDGTGLTALTDGNGTHTLTYFADDKYYIDTYSRVDMAPANELRRESDGKLACKLEEGDVSELVANGWKAPEVFVSKARDGKTDIWGFVVRPRDFDPNKKYAVVEDIYAGPHGSHTPKPFSAQPRYTNLTNLGFIVAKLDGMGTANRSKAFHDVCWQNVKDAGFPDRIIWHKAFAEKYPAYDVTRVGIYGTSAGGQNAMGALLFHPEFYKVAMAACGCHDNRMDKASWNEQWMGYPVGPHYAASSNVDNASRLRGKLLLIVGEQDHNVPPESTFRVVDALIKANKDFDLLVVPGMDHSNGGAYGTRRMQDFFVKHLQGIETPNRNAQRGGQQ